jgi:hypothetical protein
VYTSHHDLVVRRFQNDFDFDSDEWLDFRNDLILSFEILSGMHGDWPDTIIEIFIEPQLRRLTIDQ